MIELKEEGRKGNSAKQYKQDNDATTLIPTARTSVLGKVLLQDAGRVTEFLRAWYLLVTNSREPSILAECR